MRGKVLATLPKISRYRITPAYAGKSPVPVHLDAAIQDHPRLCGEKLFAFSSIFICGRITPAYAGKRIL